MAVTKIKVWFMSLDVLDDSDRLWGAGEWHLHASVNGGPVGRSTEEFEVRTGGGLSLPESDWSEYVYQSDLGPDDTVEIRFSVTEKDVFNDDELGEVSATLQYPFTNTYNDLALESPMLDGGTFYDDYRCYRLHLRVTIEEEVASTDLTGPTRIPVTRTAAGGVTFSTVKGTAFVPRLEICPVIPTPAPPAHSPPRPIMPAGLPAGSVEPDGSLAAAPTAPALNSLANPSVIPILSASDPDLANRAARLALTYYAPGNLDENKFVWRVASGPAAIIGGTTGKTISARGTGSAADTMAVFEVHWESDSGPLLATYRAWVGKLGTLPYRVNLLNGTTAAWNVAALMSSATVHSIMQVVQAITYQAGILLVPDPTNTAYEGATLFPAGNTNGIYQVAMTNNRRTRAVNTNVVSRSTRYNFRPGVINIAIVHSTSGGTAAAVERNGIAGNAATVKNIRVGKRWFRVYQGDGKGSTKKLGGDPSTSWIKPSGVAKDPAGVEQELTTIHPTDRVTQAKTIDKGFVNARNSAAPPFTAAMMGQLYAFIVPAAWGQGNLGDGTWTNAQYVWNCGINFAHELGHVLGLAHRGSGFSATAPLSADGMDCKNQKGVMKGHPWDENIMTYGYGRVLPSAHDLDLIQASVVRTHPAITYPP